MKLLSFQNFLRPGQVAPHHVHDPVGLPWVCLWNLGRGLAAHTTPHRRPTGALVVVTEVVEIDMVGQSWEIG